MTALFNPLLEVTTEWLYNESTGLPLDEASAEERDWYYGRAENLLAVQGLGRPE
jgi:hypothetical protein